LAPGDVERAGVVDQEIGCFYFFFIGQLRGHAAVDFFFRGFVVGAGALHPALDALFRMASNDDELVEMRLHPGFKDERGLDDGDGVRIAMFDFVHPFFLFRDDGGMDDGVEFGDAGWRAKRGLGQTRAIDGGVGIENFFTEFCYDLRIDWFARLHEFVRHFVGLGDVSAERGEHFSDDRFSGGDAAGEADSHFYETRS